VELLDGRRVVIKARPPADADARVPIDRETLAQIVLVQRRAAREPGLRTASRTGRGSPSPPATPTGRRTRGRRCCGTRASGCSP